MAITSKSQLISPPFSLIRFQRKAKPRFPLSSQLLFNCSLTMESSTSQGSKRFGSHPPPPITIDARAPFPAIESLNQVHSVSVSMPPTPTTPKQDNRYDSFRTFSRRFDRQISGLLRSRHETHEIASSQDYEPDALPSAGRYFDALQGPELESLKPSEKLLLPQEEKWPFLLRFTISSFGMPIGVAIQALLWKTIATTPVLKFLHVRLAVNYTLWCIALSLIIPVGAVYGLKMILYFEAVKREYHHPIRVNFFFAPWIGCILISLGVPPSVAKHLHSALWYSLMAPILCLELKIYGQWMLGGERRLSKVANPSNHLAILGNFAGALLGSSIGLKEGPIFFFAIGLAHYIVVFVTLYQRLPTNETLPKDLHPVFFLFIAGPSLACVSWTAITGSFGLGSKIAYFMAMFLYAALVVRINFFRGFRFSLAWWAYTVPMTSAALATIRYTAEIDNVFMKVVSVALSFISAMACIALVITTAVHALVYRDLFPNDIVIAITLKKTAPTKIEQPEQPAEGSNFGSGHLSLE